MPTDAELQSLNNAGSAWVMHNGVNGRIFGYGSNRIFLPATGWRFTNGVFNNNAGVSAAYWSSTQTNTGGIAINFGGFSNMVNAHRAHGFPVRCVEDTPSTRTRSTTPIEIMEFLGGARENENPAVLTVR